ncbi:hypothetical protein AAFF_G00233730 [Aldrovandia affinis]|uniref:Uncharacterized protein n=1 Tax=Aldrovandia affinis TaxID=143900 RepID=A0AAD7REK0_9TELE|nr:hypothetical protein AAFF_G00233730 [Aldrovandia affinis]
MKPNYFHVRTQIKAEVSHQTSTGTPMRKGTVTNSAPAQSRQIRGPTHRVRMSCARHTIQTPHPSPGNVLTARVRHSGPLGRGSSKRRRGDNGGRNLSSHHLHTTDNGPR